MTTSTVDQLEKVLRDRYWIAASDRRWTGMHVWVITVPDTDVFDIWVGGPHEVAAFWMERYGLLDGRTVEQCADLIKHTYREMSEVKVLKKRNWLTN